MATKKSNDPLAHLIELMSNTLFTDSTDRTPEQNQQVFAFLFFILLIYRRYSPNHIQRHFGSNPVLDGILPAINAVAFPKNTAIKDHVAFEDLNKAPLNFESDLPFLEAALFSQMTSNLATLLDTETIGYEPSILPNKASGHPRGYHYGHYQGKVWGYVLAGSVFFLGAALGIAFPALSTTSSTATSFILPILLAIPIFGIGAGLAFLALEDIHFSIQKHFAEQDKRQGICYGDTTLADNPVFKAISTYANSSTAIEKQHVTHIPSSFFSQPRREGTETMPGKLIEHARLLTKDRYMPSASMLSS